MKRSLWLHPQFPHFVSWVLALPACLPLLWSRMLPRPWRADAPQVCGYLITAAVSLSLIMLIITCVRLLVRLDNLRALGHIILCGMQWFFAFGLFSVLAYIADVAPPEVKPPPPPREKIIPVVKVNKVSPLPVDVLYGSRSLTIPIDLSGENESTADVSTLISPSNLIKLEKEHPKLLEAYIKKSPLWSASAGDTSFFNKPWHVVMPVKKDEGANSISVHAAFISIFRGQKIPSEYTIIKADSPFPVSGRGNTPFPDLALDLGGQHYLLLAWRGPADTQLTLSALNAAIATIDKMLRPLAESPTQRMLKSLCLGNNIRKSIEGNEASILLAEPHVRSGFYQAQILVNPGQAGFLIVEITESASRTQLFRFELPARFSDNPNELFYHDIPGDLPEFQQHILTTMGLIPKKGSPLFAFPKIPGLRPSTPPSDSSDSPPNTPSAPTSDNPSPTPSVNPIPSPLSFDVSFDVSFVPHNKKNSIPLLSETFRVITTANHSEPQSRPPMHAPSPHL